MPETGSLIRAAYPMFLLKQEIERLLFLRLMSLPTTPDIVVCPRCMGHRELSHPDWREPEPCEGCRGKGYVHVAPTWDA